MPADQPPRVRWGARLILAGTSTALAVALTLGIGEWVVRYREQTRTTVPGTMSKLFYPHERQRHGMVRDHDYFGWVRINAHGMRGADVSVEKPTGTVRIMTVGGSTTFDTFVAGGEPAPWPAQLEVALRPLLPGTPVEVLNAGVPGYRAVDNAIRMQLELFAYRPDLVVIMHAHNDLFLALRQGVESGAKAGKRPGAVPAVSPWMNWLRSNSLLYHKLNSRMQALRFSARVRATSCEDCPATSGPTWPERLEWGVQAFERDMRALVLLTQAAGAQVVLVEPPHVSGAGTRTEPDSAVQQGWRRSVAAPPEVTLDGYVQYAAVLERIAQETGATFVSTRDFGLRGPGLYATGDPIHFNDEGASRMARALAPALLEAVRLDTLATQVSGVRP